MNFLGHILLSGDNLQVQLGNLMADGLPSKDFEKYPPLVQHGIAMHHKIDAYTDSHISVKQAIELLKQTQGRYASVLIDIFIDHYLALNWERFHPTPLADFSKDFYSKIKTIDFELPKHTSHMLFYMEKYDWLKAYAYKEGLVRVMQGMSRRASFKNKIAESVEHFWADKTQYYQWFETFLQDIIIEAQLNF